MRRRLVIERSSVRIPPRAPHLSSPELLPPPGPILGWRAEATRFRAAVGVPALPGSSASLLAVPSGASRHDLCTTRLPPPAGHRMLASGRVACRSNESWAGGADLSELSAQ